MLTQVVHAALQICEGTEYSMEGICGSCGGILSGYDTRTKRFAILYDNDDEHPVEVLLHRAYCRTCGRILMPEEPFYPGTRVGSPVVDLCRALSLTMPCGQVATRLGQMGIKVDRWSVRSYSQIPFFSPPIVPAFGMNLPISIVSLSALAGTHTGSGHISGEEVLAACNYPSRSKPSTVRSGTE
jgi:hypothetical protein